MVIWVKVVDRNNKPININDLTDTGRQDAIYQAKELIDKLNDLE